MLVFAVYTFLIILMVGGIGIDLMRFERDRSRLQYTLDRAVLAAADLDQPMQPEAVVQDYFAKSGLGDYLASVSVDQGTGYRVVSATASADVKTQFMHMNGVDTLTAPAVGTAEERIDGVEISLVLDVSGSMNSNSRLPNLIVAARDFVDTMDNNSVDGDLSISIIPYATQVSVPDGLMAEFNVSTEHDYSNCINFQSADFDTPSMSSTQAYQRTMHFDPWKDYDGMDNNPKVLMGDTSSTLPVCEAMSGREVLVLQKDTTVLKNYISNLTARGNTSIDVGMKWGTALLDPSLRPAINAMIGDGIVPADFAARPGNYNDGDTLKVIVLMTDGQNTSQYYINDGFREGPSDLWFNDQEDRWSVYYPPYDAYYWPHNDQWADHPYGQDGMGCVGDSVASWSCSNRTEDGTAENVDYPDLWAYVSLKANVKRRYYPFMNDSTAYSQWYYDVRNYVNSTIKNARTKAICDTAKDQQIIVFTIGFEAPDGGQAVLKDCASSDAHYFDVDGLEITDAFASIASSIRKLRLTQ
ncbi:pilus assembly protein TadG-related protein [Sedimentitalea sp. HM32M-2]|uniref:pilus assembly protein TadG-related protein n=1 Tax=Sedimentitalea sp. HM32M-2 TaxID=3351566 RepID=UPI0036321D13